MVLPNAIETRGLTRTYGALAAVSDTNLTVANGARVAVIGPNGAGKSTLLGLIGGTIQPSSGTITLNGRDVTPLPAHKRARVGLVKTFQHSSLFHEATALENIRIAVRQRKGLAASLLRKRRSNEEVEDESRHHLDVVGLGAKAESIAGALSHGERRGLDLAVALALEPIVLLLDEPMAGMTKADSDRLTALLRDLPSTITLVLIEHDMDVVFTLANNVVVMAAGEVVDRGSPTHIQSSSVVKEAYLGQGESGGFFHG